MSAYKTPGVYIVEKNAFPNAVVAVATAIPAFIGYTERADNKGTSLHNKPWRITSLDEFTHYFGGAAPITFALTATTDLTGDPLTTPLPGHALELTSYAYLLYNCMRLFFQNGGGPCYIVSVGDYSEPVSADRLKAGIDQLVNEQEPSLLVIPEAVRLPFDQCIDVQQHMLNHSGYVMRNRFAILDIPAGDVPLSSSGNPAVAFRDHIGNNFLDYGAAYYPWLHTNITSVQELKLDLLDEASRQILSALPLGQGTDASTRGRDQQLLVSMAHQLNCLPPSSAMAGVYTMVDNTRGVWKAPANVSLNGVLCPAVNLSADEQAQLNMDVGGKSINAIRSFVCEGTLVWGARTLDGNSLDWRYINVRRTMIMLEESIRLAAKAYVFEPNTATTWVTIKRIISNFLINVWKQGGLAGTTAEDAFSVHVGLGETMTAEDVLEGILRVTVLLALSKPAEFLEITFQQQMQKS